MSLIQRVERAQQQAINPDAGAAVPVALPPPVPLTPDRMATREELLREFRLRLQAEVMVAFDSLLDVDRPGRASDARSRLIVERIVRDERLRGHRATNASA